LIDLYGLRKFKKKNQMFKIN